MSFYLLDRHVLRNTPREDGKGRPWYTSRIACHHGYSTPHLIVLHSAENLPDWVGEDAGAENVAKYGSTISRASWHWTVDSDSTIAMLPHSHTAFHVRNFNSCSIGIEIATQAGKWLDAPIEWLHELYDRIADLMVAIKNDSGIPLLDRRTEAHKWGVTTHAVLDPTRRTDPGQAFPFDWVLQMANGGFRYGQQTIEPVPTDPNPPSRPLEFVDLLGAPSVSMLRMQDWARSKNASDLFVELGSYAWTESVRLGVDPAVTYGIMGHETGFGRFGGVLDVSFNNYGGIKTASGGSNSDPNAHQRFISPHLGVLAVVQHVAGYAGVKLHSSSVVDPRFRLLSGKRIVSIPSDEWSWASTEHDSNVVRYVHEMRAT